MVKDRELYEKSLRAFVSHVRAYKEHELSYIFPFANLNLTQLARSFSLISVPNMAEVRGKNIEIEAAPKSVIDQIPYLDKRKETARREKMEERRRRRSLFHSHSLFLISLFLISLSLIQVYFCVFLTPFLSSLCSLSLTLSWETLTLTGLRMPVRMTSSIA